MNSTTQDKDASSEKAAGQGESTLSSKDISKVESQSEDGPQEPTAKGAVLDTDHGDSAAGAVSSETMADPRNLETSGEEASAGSSIASTEKSGVADSGRDDSAAFAKSPTSTTDAETQEAHGAAAPVLASSLDDGAAAPRRHDIDWLRVIAIGALLVFHSALPFQPWAKLLGFIQHESNLEWLWAIVSIFNGWRIPLLFVLSGMGVYLAMSSRSWGKLIGERTRRILVPLLFGSILIVPVNLAIFNLYYDLEVSYFPFPHHLWFLGNIYIYILLCIPLLIALRRAERLCAWLAEAFSHPAALYLLAIPLALESYLTDPEFYTFYAMNLHGFLLGLIVFLYGFGILWLGEPVRAAINRTHVINLGLGLGLYFVRVFVYELEPPLILGSLETFFWTMGLIGLANIHLNKPGAWLQRLSRAAYPVYIMHMTFLTIASYYLFPLPIPSLLTYVLVTAFCFAGSYAIYAAIINRVVLFQFLFGLRIRHAG